MKYVGYSENFHDAGLAIVTKDGDIEFASHAERYSKLKNDSIIPETMWSMVQDDDHLTYYEDPFERKKAVESHKDNRANVIIKANADPSTILYDEFCLHHISHAAGGLYTRPWDSLDDTVILTIDGFGEWQSSCIFDSKFNLLNEHTRPTSIGVPYSRMTRELGLKPLEDEYITMGLSSYGEPNMEYVQRMNNLYHTDPEMYGVIKEMGRKGVSDQDRAATIQKWAEGKIIERAKEARKYGSKLIYSGGVAQNIIANTMIRDLFDDVWIPPAVTDAGSGLGCAAWSWGKATGKNKLNWRDAYLGYEIKNEVNPNDVVDHLLNHTYCGIANGRAEYGPRALGNRSLIADVRYDVKDTVNAIKRRQKYRPFAPAILEEFADEYFEGHMNEYMQYAAKAKHDYKSVIHVDGTSRVQIVPKDSTSIFRKIIEEYYERTGIPMLLNTSLNIKGRPMVNDELDAKLFEQKYKVKVF